IRSRAAVSIARTSVSSSSASSSSAPSASDTASRHSSASLAAGASWLNRRPASAKRRRSEITSGSDICACASWKRASICSTSDSITQSILGHDLEAQKLLGVRVLDGEHGLEGGHGDRELLQVGLARG